MSDSDDYSDQESEEEDYGRSADRESANREGEIPREVIKDKGNIVDEANKFSSLADDVFGDEPSDDEDDLFNRKKK